MLKMYTAVIFGWLDAKEGDKNTENEVTQSLKREEEFLSERRERRILEKREMEDRKEEERKLKAVTEAN